MIKDDFKKEIDALENSLKEVKERISKTDAEKVVLQNTTQDEHNKVLDHHLYNQIDELVKRIYNIETKDKADSKMGNASVLGLLNELEKSIDFYL